MPSAESGQGSYFPIKLHKTADLDPQYNYIFGVHPHGVVPYGGFVNFCTEASGFSQLFPGITPHLLTLNGMFRFPFARDYLLFTGLCATSRDSLDWLLGKSVPGTAAIIPVGGTREVLEAYPNHYAIYLSRRKGFIRKAIQHGAYLVPVFSFGEPDLYDQYTTPWIYWFHLMTIKALGFPVALIKSLMPHRRPINTIVGRPIKVRKNLQPTTEEIDNTHRLYMDLLTILFDENKQRFGLEKDKKLEII